jgi:hypothetical protein
LKIATNCFEKKDLEKIQSFLSKKYGLRTSLQKTGHTNQYNVSVFKESMPILIQIVQPFMVSTMFYKLGF